MIEIQNLKKSFGEKCACDIPQLSIGSGEIIGLVGNNGAGKTTLFRLAISEFQTFTDMYPKSLKVPEANAAFIIMACNEEVLLIIIAFSGEEGDSITFRLSPILNLQQVEQL